jgi:hypothetical protein
MSRYDTQRRAALTWRVFSRDAGANIQNQIRAGELPHCPCCHGILEARPQSRLCRDLPLDATGYDLDCRGCRRFWCVVRHSARSLRLVRMRRFAAAVRAVPALETSMPQPA